MSRCTILQWWTTTCTNNNNNIKKKNNWAPNENKSKTEKIRWFLAFSFNGVQLSVKKKMQKRNNVL